jgi:hypothetical protein
MVNHHTTLRERYENRIRSQRKLKLLVRTVDTILCAAFGALVLWVVNSL